jgi:hypothetical protein
MLTTQAYSNRQQLSAAARRKPVPQHVASNV